MTDDMQRAREKFEAWLSPCWSREGDTDEDGDFVYREEWVQGAWVGYRAAAAPGIDLSGVRGLVNRWRNANLRAGMGWKEALVICLSDLDLELALIDATPKGSSDAPACMHATDLASLLWRELSNNGFLIGGPDFESVAHPIDKARFLAIAETVQDAMQATSAEVEEQDRGKK